ncbi:hypothetical protein JXO52_17920 [bacterium]|nr:hypothetical protein [bacterium]
MHFFKHTWQKAVFWILVAAGLLTPWGYPLYAMLAFIAALELVRFIRERRDWTRPVTVVLYGGTALWLFRAGAELDYSAVTMSLAGLCAVWGIVLPLFLRPDNRARE